MREKNTLRLKSDFSRPAIIGLDGRMMRNSGVV